MKLWQKDSILAFRLLNHRFNPSLNEFAITHFIINENDIILLKTIVGKQVVRAHNWFLCKLAHSNFK